MLQLQLTAMLLCPREIEQDVLWMVSPKIFQKFIVLVMYKKLAISYYVFISIVELLYITFAYRPTRMP